MCCVVDLAEFFGGVLPTSHAFATDTTPLMRSGHTRVPEKVRDPTSDRSGADRGNTSPSRHPGESTLVQEPTGGRSVTDVVRRSQQHGLAVDKVSLFGAVLCGDASVHHAQQRKRRRCHVAPQHPVSDPRQSPNPTAVGDSYQNPQQEGFSPSVQRLTAASVRTRLLQPFVYSSGNPDVLSARMLLALTPCESPRASCHDSVRLGHVLTCHTYVTLLSSLVIIW